MALSDAYFIERKLYPNVDFYSGVIYRAIGIPVQMFTVLFAMGRLPGWIAHWMEMHQNPNKKICRPRQIYVGANKRDFVPMEKRKLRASKPDGQGSAGQRQGIEAGSPASPASRHPQSSLQILNVRLRVRDPHAVFFVGHARRTSQRGGHIQKLVNLRHDEAQLQHHGRGRLPAVALSVSSAFVRLVFALFLGLASACPWRRPGRSRSRVGWRDQLRRTRCA